MQSNDSKFIPTQVNSDHRGRTFRIPAIQPDMEEDETPYFFCSINPKKWTLRGFHFQKPPHGEKKLITCLTGSIFLAVYDPNYSKTNQRKLSTYELDSGKGQSVLVGEGLATAWMTTEENTTVLYQIQGLYVPESSTGFRYDDPQIGVRWPSEPTAVAQKDLEW